MLLVVTFFIILITVLVNGGAAATLMRRLKLRAVDDARCWTETLQLIHAHQTDPNKHCKLATSCVSQPGYFTA